MRIAILITVLLELDANDDVAFRELDQAYAADPYATARALRHGGKCTQALAGP